MAAAIGAGVGPRLYDRVRSEVAAFPDAPRPIRIDPGFDLTHTGSRKRPRGRPIRVVLWARPDERHAAGLDIAVMGVSRAVDLLQWDPADIELVPPAVSADGHSTFRALVLKLAGKPALRVTLTMGDAADHATLERQLQRAPLVLMPARAEGFGLIGLETIVAGTPVLVSEQNGLGELLREVVPADASEVVVPAAGNGLMDVHRWALRSPPSCGIRTPPSKRRSDFGSTSPSAALGWLRPRRCWARWRRGRSGLREHAAGPPDYHHRGAVVKDLVADPGQYGGLAQRQGQAVDGRIGPPISGTHSATP